MSKMPDGEPMPSAARRAIDAHKAKQAKHVTMSSEELHKLEREAARMMIEPARVPSVADYKPITEPRALFHLKAIMRWRRQHKKRARLAIAAYKITPSPANHMRLLITQEASRGSRIRARRLHEAWQSAVAVVRR